MRIRRAVTIGMLVFAAGVVSAGPAAALRPSCDEILSLQRSGGRSDDEIIRTYGTTRARLAACERLSQQSSRFEARRAHFLQRREARGLDH